jgi:transcriptional regulator with GAF, ATPase, and Fis domain
MRKAPSPVLCSAGKVVLELPDSGVIFLNEIGGLSAETQIAMLRVASGASL